MPYYRDVGLVRYHSIEMLVLATCNSFRVEHDHSIESNSSLLTHAVRIFKPDTRTLSRNPLFVKHNAVSSRRPTSTLPAQTTMNLGTPDVPGLPIKRHHIRGVWEEPKVKHGEGVGLPMLANPSNKVISITLGPL